MSLVYRTMKSVWRFAIPHEVGGYFFNGRTRLSRAILSVKLKFEMGASHDEIYDAAYYANYTDEMQVSARGIVDSIIRHLSPQSVIDIGCGSGEVLQRFKECGVSGRGADLSAAARNYCISKGLDVSKIDLENVDDVPPWRADVVICLEVAEHLPAQSAKHFVNVLVGMAQLAIVITAAPPGQGGTDHVNERPPDYWIELFKTSGAIYSDSLTLEFRREWDASNVERSRSANVLVFTQN